MAAPTNGQSTNGESSGRVWDRFLSERDRTHRPTQPPRPPRFGERPALLLIDLYRWVFGDQPEPVLEAMKTWPGSCGLEAWESLPHLQKLLAAAREARIPVIHTTGFNDDTIRQWAKGSSTRAAQRDEAAADRYRRRNEIVDEVAPIEGELVIHKSSPSAFWGSPLLGHLIDHGIDTIIVGGESTSGCVRASVVDGCTNRYKMIVVEECVFDRTEAAHAIDLFTMNQKYADVVPLETVLPYLDRIAEEHPAEAR
jgi:maleamate amidohydrolase